MRGHMNVKKNISYYECVSVAVAIQYAKFMQIIKLPSVAGLSVTYFSTLSPKRHIFWGKVTGHKMRVLICSTICIWNISHSTKN